MSYEKQERYHEYILRKLREEREEKDSAIVDTPLD